MEYQSGEKGCMSSFCAVAIDPLSGYCAVNQNVDGKELGGSLTNPNVE